MKIGIPVGRLPLHKNKKLVYCSLSMTTTQRRTTQRTTQLQLKTNEAAIRHRLTFVDP